MAGLDYTYRYPFASYLSEVESAPGLVLSTCDVRQDHPQFFAGKLREPKLVGEMLLALSDVVRTHYWLPRPPNTDPVVTSAPEMLRFEGFSGCCGVYARVDLPAGAFDRDIQRSGTTNVDFNAAMRNSLQRLRTSREASLSVGRDGVELTHSGETVVEKKVKLPIRWLKGFSEVQAYQAGLTQRVEVPGAEARRFVRSLPAGVGPKNVSYVVASGNSLRLSQVSRPGAVPVQGMNRIRAIEPLLTSAKSLRIWSDDAGVSGWEVNFPTGRFFLLISPQLQRGFSGEGQALSQLAAGKWQEALPYVQANLAGQTQIDAAALATKLGLGLPEVTAALAVLGTRGVAGFDVASGKFFHRELPFQLDQIETLQPRLKDARKFLAEKEVKVLATPADQAWDVSVPGTEVQHHVRLRPAGDRCTCQWFSKYQGERGPCKHILAARMFVEKDTGEDEE